MLYRAFVYPPASSSSAEVLTFFEAASDSQAADRLRAVVAAAWCCDESAVDFYNLISEHDLRDRSEPGTDRRDLVLLETGFGRDGAHYADPLTTALLVSPRWHARLLSAQVDAAQATRPAPTVSGRKCGSRAPAATLAA